MIKYSLVMRGEPRNPEKPKKVYASAQCAQTLSLEELARHIQSHGCVYSVADFVAVTKMLAEATTRMLQEGCRVELDELGTFYPTLGCEGAESMDAFQPDKHIKEVRANWKPGKAFRNLRDGIEFEENMNRRTERKLLAAERKGENKIEL